MGHARLSHARTQARSAPVWNCGNSPAGSLFPLINMGAGTGAEQVGQAFNNRRAACQLGLGDGWFKPDNCIHCKNQHKCQLAGLCHSIHWHVLGEGASCIRLDWSTSWKVKDQGLEVGLVRQLWALCWAPAPTGMQESHD